jgi:ribosomal protein S18 acetylase RimI-like enzyme
VNTSLSLVLDAALSHAQTDDELAGCFPAMHDLRPLIPDARTFVAACRRMEKDGYRILAAWDGDAVVALAGYRVKENFVFGKFLYVDDLVARESARKQRWGARLLAGLRQIAAEHGCARLVLDTALTNALAQKFYFRAGLLPLAIGFSTTITSD